MSRFANFPRPSFVRRTGADEKTPGRLVCRGVTRRPAMLAEAREVLGVLPGPGEALHALITGRYRRAGQQVESCCEWLPPPDSSSPSRTRTYNKPVNSRSC